MALAGYGVLKGRATEVRRGGGKSPHYQVRLVDRTTEYRIAVNVQSAVAPSEVEYLVVDDFQHPILDVIEPLERGFTPLQKRPGSGALDYIRGNLFDRSRMKPLAHDIPGPDNDLYEKVDAAMQRALADEEALVYAFGQRWGPEPGERDKIFGFLPGNGIHDIHVNQGNVERFKKDDGVWQDGGLIVHFPASDQWLAVFLKFQSQSWHTDDTTGHTIGAPVPAGTIPPGGQPVPGVPVPPAYAGGPDEPFGAMRIVAALVNAIDTPESEAVTLLNPCPHAVDLTGWRLLDSQKHTMGLPGQVLAPGAAIQIAMAQRTKAEVAFALSNQGGIITLLDPQGLKVDGVSYTREQARHPGWTIVFKS